MISPEYLNFVLYILGIIVAILVVLYHVFSTETISEETS